MIVGEVLELNMEIPESETLAWRMCWCRNISGIADFPGQEEVICEAESLKWARYLHSTHVTFSQIHVCDSVHALVQVCGHVWVVF